MTNIDTDKLYERAWIRYGQNAQMAMLIEEMAELIVVICHSLRDNRKPIISTVDDLASEIADVEIMLEQCTLMLGLIPLVNSKKDEKLSRLITRLERNIGHL